MSSILPGLIIGLREGLEAFLIISLMLEYLNKLNKMHMKKSVLQGLYFGLAISVVLGVVLYLITKALQEGGDAVGKLWEAGASIAAAVLISFFVYWMLKHGDKMTTEIQNSMGHNLSKKGLFFLSALAVAREGTEIALFAFSADSTFTYTTGTLLGVVIAAVIAVLIYKSLMQVNIGLIFRVTLIYLIFQAAYLFGYAIHEFLSALKVGGFLDSTSLLFSRVYNLQDTLLDHKTGALGIFLNITIGWYSRPEYIQFIAQGLYLVIFAVIGKKLAKSHRLSAAHYG